MRGFFRADGFPVAALIFLLTFVAAPATGNAQSVFVESPCTSTAVCAAAPYYGGVETLPNGNVLVARIRDNFSSTPVISIYSPQGPNGQGVEVDRLTFNFNVGGSVYFTRDPASGWIVGVLGNGSLFAFNPANTIENGFLFDAQSIRAMPASNASVYDVATGQTNFPVGAILYQNASYNDIAMRHVGEQIDIFVSGIDGQNTRPFIVRLRINASSIPSLVTNPTVAKTMHVVASSRVPSPKNLSPGVAINLGNVVLTTLPICTGGTVDFCQGTRDVALAFGADMPEGGGLPPQILYNNTGVSSRGIGVDSDGNFYVATGSLGSFFCPQAPDGLVKIPRNRTSTPTCYPPVSNNLTGPAQTLDAAPNTGRNFVYVPTNYATGGPYYVIRFDNNTSAAAQSIASVGLYNPFTSTFFLRNATPPPPALTFAYGPEAAGWTPLTGDWNGDGIVTVGLYSYTNSHFFLRNTNSAGAANLVFGYGPAAGWLPIAGDWNGDGVDTIGLYNPTSSTFFLKNANSEGSADLVFSYGPSDAGWLPVAGDWNNDGIDTIGLYNPNTGTFFLKNSNAGGVADLVFGYGPASMGWLPLSGDWNGDGLDSIGLYDPSNSTFFLKNTNSAGAADRVFSYGPAGAGWKPVTGDWDGQ